MNTPDIIGLVLLGLGVLIFVIAILAPKFRSYAGINEYKKVRAKYMPKKEKKVASDSYNSTGDGLSTISSILMGIVSLGITGSVGWMILSQFNEVMAEDAGMNVTIIPESLATGVSPFFALFAVIFITAIGFGMISLFKE